MGAVLSLKTNYSGYHINGAALFARSAAQIESDLSSPLEDEARTKYFSSITASVLMSVAALESKINEIYIFAVDRNPNVFQGVEVWIIDTLQELWSTIEEKPILTKYQLALTVCKKEKFNKGENPYQDAHRLITLRNALVHYKPEWDTVLNEHKKLESYLSNRFPVSPFSHVNDAFFPKKCIGHGCASWSVKTAVNFIDEFYKRLGIHEAFISNDNLATE
jgi:hypothetical protein